MRTKTTPWNRSYDLAKELRKGRPRGVARSQAQQAVKRDQQRTFRIHEEPKKPQELPEEWKAIGDSRKRAMENAEDKLLREELKEVWE